MGLRIGCGLVCLRRSSFWSAFAVIPFGHVVGPRSVLVLVGPRGGYVCLKFSSRVVLGGSCAFGLFSRSASGRRGPSRFALVLFVLRVRWFRIVCSVFGAACWSTQSEIAACTL